MKCSATTKKGNPCGKSVYKGSKCHIHHKDEITQMYKKELKKMHERVRFYNKKCSQFHDKIELIHKWDWIKSELISICCNRPFKYIIVDPRYRNQLEDLFNVPFSEVPETYTRLLHERNRICHKYTMSGFV